MAIQDLIGMHKGNPLAAEVQAYIANERVDNKLKYIGIISHQNAGKDFVANYIAKNVERKCQVVKFATKLTQVVAAALCVDDLSLFQDRIWKEKKIFQWQNKIVSARDVQISLGTDILRGLVDDNIWVTAFSNAYNDPDILYIISDLRFLNEFKFVQDNSGIVIFIDNHEAAENQRRKEAGVVHSSEELTWDLHHGVQQPDYILDNNDYGNPQPLQDLLTFFSTV